MNQTHDDLSVALDMTQDLMDGGFSFVEAIARGLNESGTVERYNREKAERKAGKRPCRYDRSAIMRTAWQYRKGEGLTMSAALKRAWADAKRSTLRVVA
jgi:hypothetical protein